MQDSDQAGPGSIEITPMISETVESIKVVGQGPTIAAPEVKLVAKKLDIEAELAELLGELFRLDTSAYSIWKKQLTGGETSQLRKWNDISEEIALGVRDKLQQEVNIARNNKDIKGNAQFFGFCCGCVWAGFVGSTLANHSVRTFMYGHLAIAALGSLGVALGYLMHSYYKQKERALLNKQNEPSLREVIKNVRAHTDYEGHRLEEELNGILSGTKVSNITIKGTNAEKNKKRVANNIVHSRLGHIKAFSQSHYGFWQQALEKFPEEEVGVDQKNAIETAMFATQQRLQNRKNAADLPAFILAGSCIVLATINMYDSQSKISTAHTLMQINLFTLWAVAAISLPFFLYSVLAAEESQNDIQKRVNNILGATDKAAIDDVTKQVGSEAVKSIAVLPVLTGLGFAVAAVNFDIYAKTTLSISGTDMGIINFDVFFSALVLAGLTLSTVCYLSGGTNRGVSHQLDEMSKPSTSNSSQARY